MDGDVLPALMLYSFVSSITPGPNNLMLMASGANFGFRRTIPHMLGVALGLVILALLLGAGLAGLFIAYPASHTVLKLASVLYLLWLAWKIAHAAPARPGAATGAPMTFLQAAAFQWVNPKAWAMALTVVTVYPQDRSMAALLAATGVFGAVNFSSIGSWVVLGQQMARILTSRRRLAVFNWTMALLLVGSLYPVLWSG